MRHSFLIKRSLRTAAKEKDAGYALALEKDQRGDPPARDERPFLRLTTQPEALSFPEVEARYLAAKARLLAAQDESGSQHRVRAGAGGASAVF